MKGVEEWHALLYLSDNNIPRISATITSAARGMVVV